MRPEDNYKPASWIIPSAIKAITRGVKLALFLHEDTFFEDTAFLYKRTYTQISLQTFYVSCLCSEVLPAKNQVKTFVLSKVNVFRVCIKAAWEIICLSSKVD